MIDEEACWYCGVSGGVKCKQDCLLNTGITKLHKQAISDLMRRIKPLVHIGGAAAVDGHSDEEDAAIGREFRKWYGELDCLDNAQWCEVEVVDEEVKLFIPREPE